MAEQIDWATNYMGTKITISNLDAAGNVIPAEDSTTPV
jgi:hypothetical protein